MGTLSSHQIADTFGYAYSLQPSNRTYQMGALTFLQPPNRGAVRAGTLMGTLSFCSHQIADTGGLLLLVAAIKSQAVSVHTHFVHLPNQIADAR
jgi:hypothetical protein